MIGHYIEDDALDALSVMTMVNDNHDLVLSTSTSLDDFDQWVQPDDVDFILLDIHRPDTRSLKSDVDTIRSFSRAPIFFVTGDEAKFYREEAVTAGAQAVLEKDSLTADNLLILLENVASDHFLEEQGKNAENPSQFFAPNVTHPAQAPAMPEHCPQAQQRFARAMQLIRTATTALAKAEPGETTTRRPLQLLAASVPILQAYCAGNRDLTDGPTPSLPQSLRAIQKGALAMARERGISLVFQLNANAIDGLDNPARVSLGIRYLLYAALACIPKGGTLTFKASPSAGGVHFAMASSAPFAFDTDQALSCMMPDQTKRFEASYALALAFLLLDTRDSDQSLFSKGSMHLLLVDHAQSSG